METESKRNNKNIRHYIRMNKHIGSRESQILRSIKNLYKLSSQHKPTDQIKKN